MKSRMAVLALVVCCVLSVGSLNIFHSNTLEAKQRGDTAIIADSPPLHPEDSKLQIEKQTRMVESFGQLPLYFIENRGQQDERVRYYEKGPGRAVFFTREEAVFALVKGEKETVLRLSPLGGNLEAEVVAEAPQEGRVNSFVGNDPSRWRTDIMTYGKVRYRDVYPGVDLVYYGTGRQMEFDFEVSPGRSVDGVALTLKGADRLELTSEGDLKVHAGEDHILYRKPVAYQEVDGQRREVACSFQTDGNERVAFTVAAYDSTKRLVIDPVLAYSTYLGGTSNDGANGIAVDAVGNAYVTGYTRSIDFPTTQASYQPRYCGDYDIFITKLNATGSALVYSTFLGGIGDDRGFGIAVDSGGNAYATGYTKSDDFPTNNPLQTDLNGVCDIFITKLNPTGNALVFSTYLGSAGIEEGYGIAVDSLGRVYVAGCNSPVDGDAFIAKLNADGQSLAFSKQLGGSNEDKAYGIAVDSSFNIYVTGSTESDDFPTQNPFQIYGSGTDAFVTKFAENGIIVYSTYLAGNSFDRGWAIVVDSSGSAYVVGVTYSSDFPIKFPFQSQRGGADVFITKLNAAGNSLVFSTCFGGYSADGATGIALDSSGNIYIIGSTCSSNFIITPNAFQSTIRGSSDAFITKIDATGSAVLFSTYLGGSSYYDYVSGIAVDPSGNAYVAGCTYSSDFPTTENAVQPSYSGSYETFITKLANPLPAMSGPPVGPTAGKPNTLYQFTADATDPEGETLKYRFNWGDGSISPYSTVPSLEHAWANVGVFCIKAQAKDSSGGQSSWSPCSNIIITNPPVMSGVPSGLTAGGVNTSLSFTASATDPDGDALQYRFNWGDGIVSPWSANTTVAHTWTAVGNYCVKAQAKDAPGLVSNWSACSNIAITTPPVMSGAPSGPTSGSVGTSLSFTASATDPDGDALMYRFNWGDGTLSSWSTNPTASHTWTQGGSYCVKAIAKDSHGVLSSWSVCRTLSVN